jgi:Ca2+-dependent lipid-binding protein
MLNAASAEALRQNSLLNGGTAHVTVNFGKNLIGKNSSIFSSNKTSDPYVKILSGGRCEIGKTKTISKNLNPTWNETFKWEIGGKEPPCIVFAIFDKNTLTSDEPMGIVTISLSTVKVVRNIPFFFKSPHFETYSKCWFSFLFDDNDMIFNSSYTACRRCGH